MNATDADRAFARWKAQRVHALYLAEVGGTPLQIAQNIGFEETCYRGVLAECVFGRKFGVRVNTDVLSLYDGGVDFLMELSVFGVKRSTVVNIKATSVRVNFAGMAGTTHLKVPVQWIKPDTVYVYGVYLEWCDDADVLRWAFGHELIERNERELFENGNRVNFIKPYSELRPIEELRDRM